MRQQKDREIAELKRQKEQQRVEFTTEITRLEIYVQSKWFWRKRWNNCNFSVTEQSTTILSLESDNLALSEFLAKKEDVERQLDVAR